MKLLPIKTINEFYLYVINPIPSGLIHCTIGELYYRAGLSSYSSDEYMELAYFLSISSCLYSYIIGFFSEAWIRFKSAKHKWGIRLIFIILFNFILHLALGWFDDIFTYNWMVTILNMLLGQSIILITAYALLRIFTIAPNKIE